MKIDRTHDRRDRVLLIQPFSKTFQVLAIGKFGEADGCHAIRLRDPVAPAESAPAAVPAPEAPMMAPTAGPDLPIGDLHRPDAFRPDPTTAATVSPPERARGSKAG